MNFTKTVKNQNHKISYIHRQFQHFENDMFAALNFAIRSIDYQFCDINGIWWNAFIMKPLLNKKKNQKNLIDFLLTFSVNFFFKLSCLGDNWQKLQFSNCILYIKLGCTVENNNLKKIFCNFFHFSQIWLSNSASIVWIQIFH